MNFLKISILFFIFLILSACEDLPFTEGDTLSPETDKESTTSEIQPTEKEEVLEEILIIPKDFTLSRHRLIQSKTVILDMVTIQTLQYDLTIIADEFISHHSVIRNFPEGKTALEKEDGKSGGHILIKAKKARGSLQLILTGENAGFVPKTQISREERGHLSGRDGRNGKDAVYRNFCKEVYVYPEFGSRIPVQECKIKCVTAPTRGQNGENGRPGFPGDDGRHGGDSGSFHLQTFDMSGFHLTGIEKTPGLGSKGGRGSAGGYGGKRGRNGKDENGICDYKPSRPKRGRKGERGRSGKDGKNGKEGEVCLEQLFKIQQQKIIEEKNSDQECREGELDIMCLGIAIHREEPESIERGNVICY